MGDILFNIDGDWVEIIEDENGITLVFDNGTAVNPIESYEKIIKKLYRMGYRF